MNENRETLWRQWPWRGERCDGSDNDVVMQTGSTHVTQQDIPSGSVLKFFINMFFFSRTHQQQVLSLPQSPEANHACWPDISAKVDHCVTTRYSLAGEIIDFSYFPKI